MARKDCRQGISPPHYPPPHEMKRLKRRKTNKQAEVCPGWVGDFSLSCDDEKDGMALES